MWKRITVSPMPCCHWRVSARMKSQGACGRDGFLNSVKKLQRRETCSKKDRSFSTSSSQERCRHIVLQEEYDTHDPKGHSSLQLPLLKKRSTVFALAHSGICAAFCRGALRVLNQILVFLYFNQNL